MVTVAVDDCAAQKSMPVYQAKAYSVFADSVVQHPFIARVLSATEMTSDYKAMDERQKSDKISPHWKLTKNIAAFPQYQSSFLLSDAIYNLSLEEMINAVEPDSTFRTGKLWSGVWTRDISYSIILSMAYLQPKVAMNSLLRKVNRKGRIIQDTGTGGAYPCSTDRMIWAVAAWEIYKATGSRDWLQQAYPIIKNSVEDDINIAYDKTTGLVKGESSFLDWREQTYPKWMQPADIFESECLGTNAVHFKANKVLSEMATVLNQKEVAEKHAAIAEKIKKAINTYLWQPAKGYYGQFLYGRNHKILSPRAEALGEALCVLWDIADKPKQQQIISSVPVTDLGIPCIFPQIPAIAPYHNNAIWPFVQTYWMWASAKAGNENAVLKSMAAIYRPAAMFLTNKENFVASNGDFAGTQINSSNMLWSLSGNISLVHAVLFGIRFHTDSLFFEPFVPRAFNGNRRLSNFRYRHTILDITMEGYGNRISGITLDGKPLEKAAVPASLTGTHTIHITLANNNAGNNAVNDQPVYFTLAAPEASFKNDTLAWMPVPGAVTYQIIKNAQPLAKIKQDTFHINKNVPALYQVMAIDKNGIVSFASEPVLVCNDKYIHTYQAEAFAPKAGYNYKGYSGDGFVELSTTVNRNFAIPITIENNGWYNIDFQYANGNGPVNTENKCAIRTLKIDQVQQGAVIFPQRGASDWNNWGLSNAVQCYFKKGRHTIVLSFEDFDDNMNIDVNQVMVDNMRIIWLKE